MSDRAKGLAVAEDILTAHPNLSGIFAQRVRDPGLSAAKSKEVAGKLKIVGFDTSATLIQDLQPLHRLAGGSESSRMGYLAVKTHRSTARTHPEKRIDTGATVANLNDPSIQEL
jgi:ribose transport system substrate-binding protein